MNKYEQTANLASTGTVETFIIFRCSNCKSARSLRTTVVYTAARCAVDEGWRVTDSAEVLCPSCMEKSR